MSTQTALMFRDKNLTMTQIPSVFSPGRECRPEKQDSPLWNRSSVMGDKPVQFRVVCPQNGTAALKGLTTQVPLTGNWYFII